LKLGLTVSPRTVGRYLRRLRPSRGGRPAQRWATFVRNHAHAVLACDFFTAITVHFRILYVFIVLDVGTRRIVHRNVTAHPTEGCDSPPLLDLSDPLKKSVWIDSSRSGSGTSGTAWRSTSRTITKSGITKASTIG
jgi:hypothetical protein